MRRFAWPGALAALAGAALLVAGVTYLRQPDRILLAPMMGLHPCLTPSSPAGGDAQTQAEMARACLGPEGSAGALAEWTLAGLEAAGATKSPRYELGYTLNVPLLKLFKEHRGDWVIDKELLGRMVRTLRDTERPVIVYLFSTHFGQDAPIEKALAKDPANLSWTPKGPLPRDVYYEADIFDWSFASSRTAITERRIQSARAVLRELCKLEPRHIQKIRGITLLGELHHLFPNFEAGMGFAPPYLVSDYSPASKAGFRESLKQQFVSIDQLNAYMESRWTTFDEIDPPSKDVRTTPLRDFTEHIDSYAHGSLPISGWAYVKDATDASPPMVRIYRDGELIGRTPVNKGRQDVLAVLPEFGTANTGWRFDMDFKSLPAGLYRIDVFLENGPQDLVRLATRDVAIVDKQQSTPQPQPQKQLPPSRTLDASVKAHIDTPADRSSYFYNPLVPFWHAFRAQQVVDYIRKFNQEVNREAGASCLARTPRYTHQIIPFTNPGWDETKFAVEASLQPIEGIGLGVSLYGEPVYGTSFSGWLATTQHKRYGITEFHPLKPLSATELGAVLEKHASQGAAFISFFMEPRWKGKPVSLGQNLFSLDPDNPKFGAAQLFDAMREILNNPPRAVP